MGIIFDLGTVLIILLALIFSTGVAVGSVSEALVSAPEYTNYIVAILVLIEAIAHIILYISLQDNNKKVNKSLALLFGFIMECPRCLITAITICNGLGATGKPDNILEIFFIPFVFIINIVIWGGIVAVSGAIRVFQFSFICDENNTIFLYPVIGLVNTTILYFVVNFLSRGVLREIMSNFIRNFMQKF